MSSSRAVGVLFGMAIAGAAAINVPANAAEDLSKLQVTPQRGQSADQARRDRYECHNWAVAQTGESPISAPTRDHAEPSSEEKHAERVNRVLSGAMIGAGLGGLVRATQNEDPANGILAGAAVGAAIGAATGREKEPKEQPKAAGPSDYLRALTACMEGRGYSVALPTAAEAVARR